MHSLRKGLSGTPAMLGFLEENALSELSKRVSRDSPTLSTAAKLLERKAQTDTGLKGLMKKMLEELFEIQICKDPAGTL